MKKASVLVSLIANIAAIVISVICVVNAYNAVGGIDISPIMEKYNELFYASLWHYILLGAVALSFILLLIGYIIDNSGAMRVLMIISACLVPISIGVVMLMSKKLSPGVLGLILLVPMLLNFIMFLIDSSYRAKILFWLFSVVHVAAGIYITLLTIAVIIAILVLKLFTPNARVWTIIDPNGISHQIIEE